MASNGSNGSNGNGAGGASRLAELAGYQEPVTSKIPVSDASVASVATMEPPADALGDEDGDSVDLLDKEDLEVTQSQKRPMWTHPLVKMGAVAVGLGVAFLAAYFVFSAAQNSQKTPRIGTPTEDTGEIEEEVDPEAEAAEESARLRTELALSTQEQVLTQHANRQQLQASQGGATPPSDEEGQPPTSASAPAPTPARPPAPATAPPPRPAPPPPAPRPAPAASPAASPSSVAEENPVEAWFNASNIGSFGVVTRSIVPPESTTPEYSEGADETLALPNALTPERLRQTFQGIASVPGYDQKIAQAHMDALATGQPSTVQGYDILAGTTVEGELITPVIWAQDLDAAEQPQRFGIALQQPLIAADGAEVLPIGTRIVARMASVSDSGMVLLSAEHVILPYSNGTEQVVELPLDALLISGRSGRPLMARNFSGNGRQIARRDMMVAAMGALGSVGQILNRPESESTSNSGFFSSSSTTYGDANIFGAVLEGAFGDLRGEISERQQDQIEDLMDRPNVWYVSERTEVEIFVGTSFRLAK